MIDISDVDRIRTIRLDRPEAKNAMNEALWDATTEAFLAAPDDPSVAVVVMTGTGDVFCAGQDIIELAAVATGGDFVRGTHGFVGLLQAISTFPKPLIIAVNGLGVGFGATVLGFADLVFMSNSARVMCPFTRLGVAPSSRAATRSRNCSAARTRHGRCSARSGCRHRSASGWALCSS